MTLFKRFKYFLWYFGTFQVPLIGHLRPKLLVLNDDQIVMKIPLRRRSRNHLNSMYFGALAVGADVAGGLHAFYYANKEKLNLSLVFKSFHAEFLRRPESDVFFVCDSGKEVRAALFESKESGERVNKKVAIDAFVNYPDKPEKIAEFILELSVRVK
ncbi:aromatic compounds catabolism [Legionella quinlivanii]|uniref:Aromatic compounds catabolism n=1 Tax=Legionella quinlivanii TaxID=45073 RepID=A0A0W0XYW3_9GAMM|nr:DUF4442 domain-containing protein [Legionella quinlivanii]KTD49664.1 aromatic compounds catabolism [Legionella quinlivanii]MCW8451970.1 DUF4442 domain-containing protein [Legionella quinlivanii]SEG30683.1 protein of unknown function [Legionella quinlivanii DSM 21216]STY09833.1 aromatic compounds catabolism [Legionella quinlivanii]